MTAPQVRQTKCPWGGGVAVVAILAVHTADDLHRALRPEPRQIAVDGGQREVGYAGLQLAVHPLRRWVAGGGTQASQYGVPLGAVPCYPSAVLLSYC